MEHDHGRRRASRCWLAHEAVTPAVLLVAMVLSLYLLAETASLAAGTVAVAVLAALPAFAAVVMTSIQLARERAGHADESDVVERQLKHIEALGKALESQATAAAQAVTRQDQAALLSQFSSLFRIWSELRVELMKETVHGKQANDPLHVLALPLRQDLGEQIGAVATASKQVLLRLKATGYDTRTWDELFAKFDK